MLEQLRSGFKSTINWNKYQSKISAERQNQNLSFLIDPSFQGVNWLFVWLLENEGDRKVHTGYYLPKVEIKDYNVKIVAKVFLISQLKIIWEHMITFEKLQQVTGMITELVVFWIMNISINTIKW